MFSVSAEFHKIIVEVARTCAWLVLLTVIFLPLERIFALHPQKFFSKTLTRDVAYYFLNGLSVSILMSVPVSVLAYGAHALVPERLHAFVGALPFWERVMVSLVIGEIGFYWGHRWTHEIPFLWRFHAIHHSSEHIYYLASSRAHPVDLVFVRLCGMIPLYVLGLASPLAPKGSLVPVITILIMQIWGYFIHANVRWRLWKLEWLVSSPAFHHWHHTLEQPIDRNYASMLPCMDWFFGTFYLPNEWPKAYGTETKLPDSMAGQLLYAVLPQQQPMPSEESPSSEPVTAVVTDAETKH